MTRLVFSTPCLTMPNATNGGAASTCARKSPFSVSSNCRCFGSLVTTVIVRVEGPFSLIVSNVTAISDSSPGASEFFVGFAAVHPHEVVTPSMVNVPVPALRILKTCFTGGPLGAAPKLNIGSIASALGTPPLDAAP